MHACLCTETHRHDTGHWEKTGRLGTGKGRNRGGKEKEKGIKRGCSGEQRERGTLLLQSRGAHFFFLGPGANFSRYGSGSRSYANCIGFLLAQQPWYTFSSQGGADGIKLLKYIACFCFFAAGSGRCLCTGNQVWIGWDWGKHAHMHKTHIQQTSCQCVYIF